jgi:hypothetical protein
MVYKRLKAYARVVPFVSQIFIHPPNWSVLILCFNMLTVDLNILTYYFVLMFNLN